MHLWSVDWRFGSACLHVSWPRGERESRGNSAVVMNSWSILVLHVGHSGDFVNWVANRIQVPLEFCALLLRIQEPLVRFCVEASVIGGNLVTTHSRTKAVSGFHPTVWKPIYHIGPTQPDLTPLKQQPSPVLRMGLSIGLHLRVCAKPTHPRSDEIHSLAHTDRKELFR